MPTRLQKILANPDSPQYKTLQLQGAIEGIDEAETRLKIASTVKSNPDTRALHDAKIFPQKERVVSAGEMYMASLRAKLYYANQIAIEEWRNPERRAVALENAAEIKRAGIGLEADLNPKILDELAQTNRVSYFQTIVDDPSNEHSIRLKRLQTESSQIFTNLSQGAQPVGVNISPYLGRTLDVTDLISKIKAAALDSTQQQAFLQSIIPPLLNQANRTIALVDAIYIKDIANQPNERLTYGLKKDGIDIKRIDTSTNQYHMYKELGKSGMTVIRFNNQGEITTITLVSNLDFSLSVQARVQNGKITHLDHYQNKDRTHTLTATKT